MRIRPWVGVFLLLGCGWVKPEPEPNPEVISAARATPAEWEKIDASLRRNTTGTLLDRPYQLDQYGTDHRTLKEALIEAGAFWQDGKVFDRNCREIYLYQYTGWTVHLRDDRYAAEHQKIREREDRAIAELRRSHHVIAFTWVAKD